MRAALLAITLLAALAAPARAGADADVTKAFTAFVEDVAAGKPLPTPVELFVPPNLDEGEPLPADLTALRAMLVKPKVTVLKVVPSRSGRSAWIAAEIAARVPRGAKVKSEALRASALLVLGDAGWTVRATHWSVGMPNVPPEMCGMLSFEWMFAPKVPKEAERQVRAVIEAINPEQPSKFQALLSDDKNALVFGSAPKEKLVGSEAIKRVFKRWEIAVLGYDPDEKKLPARAGVAPDGELMWMTAGIAYYKLCTSYRTFFVLAKEPAGWRIVHQHYSEPLN